MKKIPSGGRLRERVITSRGRKYRQAVWYCWDPVRKRGVTKVIAHLGPVLPQKRSVDKRKIYMVLAALKRERARSLTRKGARPDRSGSQHNNGTDSAANRSKQKKSKRKVDVASVLASAESRALRARVLNLLAQSPEGRTRRQLSQLFGVEPLSIPGSAQGLATADHVGMALTVLHTAGTVKRKGRGVKGDPYIYFCG